MPIAVTSEATFNKYINMSSLTVVDFTATWCGPCQMVAPIFDKLSKVYMGTNFLKLDVDENQSIAREYGVRAMPTFMFFKNGSKLEEIVGVNVPELENYLKKHGSTIPEGGNVLGSAGPDASVPKSVVTSEEAQQKWNEIVAEAKPEPGDSSDTTRVQFKMPGGTRKVRKFLKTDTVRELFVYTKTLIPDKRFELVNFREPLFEKLEMTLSEAKAINASLDVKLA